MKRYGSKSTLSSNKVNQQTIRQEKKSQAQHEARLLEISVEKILAVILFRPMSNTGILICLMLQLGFPLQTIAAAIDETGAAEMGQSSSITSTPSVTPSPQPSLPLVNITVQNGSVNADLSQAISFAAGNTTPSASPGISSELSPSLTHSASLWQSPSPSPSSQLIPASPSARSDSKKSPSPEVTNKNDKTKPSAKKISSNPFHQEKNSIKANQIVNVIKRNAPERYNHDSDNIVLYTATKENLLKGFKHRGTSPSFEIKTQIFTEEKKLIEEMQTKSRAPLIDELNEQAQAKPIFLKDQNLINTVNADYKALANYLSDVNDYAVAAEIAKFYRGGTCGEHSQMSVIEALKKGLEIEYVSLTDRKNPSSTHQFTLLGRDQGSILSDPNSWGEKAIIVDYWLLGEALYATQLTPDYDKPNPKSPHNNYFYKHWEWQSRRFTPKLPPSQQFFANKYSQFAAYYRYCEKKLQQILHKQPVLNLSSDLLESYLAEKQEEHSVLTHS